MEISIPHKHDIIPIHTSDRGTFKKCRRKWDWNSPSRRNLERRADIFGVNTALWFGTGIHYALERYYDPKLRHDPVESFLTWYNVVYHGGVVGPEWLSRVYDTDPKPAIEHTSTESNVTTVPAWKVKGLNVLLPYDDHSELEEHRELGVNMMSFYKSYAEEHDDFEVLQTEHDFSVPIWDYDNDRILRAIDVREESPNYGKELEVHYRGRMDAVRYTPSTGKYGVIDHKTTSRVDEDWFNTLELDEQTTSYLWAAEIEAQYYGLPWAGKPMENLLYQALRKTYPKLPTILNNGMFSINRQTESTTYAILERLIKEANLEMRVKLDPKVAAYVQWVKEQGDEQFIVRKFVPRNRHQLHSAGKRIYLEALDMLSQPRIYPNPSGEYHCLHCPFRVPCIATEDGIDVEPMLTNDYSSNRSR